jgi:hypothetical protein
MRHGLAVLALVVCSALPAAGEDAKYRSKDGKFDVRFPAGAKVRTDSHKGDGVEMHAVIADDGPTRRLTVTYTDVPAVKDERTKEFFDQIEKSAVRKAGGQVVSSADVEFGAMKHPARGVRRRQKRGQGQGASRPRRHTHLKRLGGGPEGLRALQRRRRVLRVVRGHEVSRPAGPAPQRL